MNVLTVLIILWLSPASWAFMPVSRFGVVRPLFAGDLSLDGVDDLELIMGTKKYKKQVKKLRQMSKNQAKEADRIAIKQARREMHLSASTGDESTEPSKTLGLLIW